MSDEPVCPLVTQYTRELGISPEVVERLYLVRKWDYQLDDKGVAHNPIPFKWPTLFRTKILNLNTNVEEDPLELRQYQLQIIHHLVRMPRFLCGDAVGLKKAQPLDTKILTHAGWIKMGDIAVGNRIIDPDTGYAAQIEGIYPQGNKPVYRLTTSDGASTECCEDHLWTVQATYGHDRKSGKFRVLTTRQLLDKGLHRKAHKNKSWKTSNFMLPLTKPVFYEEGEILEIPPYILGILLGDGGITRQVGFSNIDLEILEKLEDSLPPSLKLHKTKTGSDWIIACESGGKKLPDVALGKGAHTRFHTRRGTFNPKCKFCVDPNQDVFGNDFVRALSKLGLLGKKSPEKFIPPLYLHASLENRTELLRGLMDTDGCCTRDGVCILGTSSSRLRDDVVELIRSLGGIVTIGQRLPTYKYKGELKTGKLCYVLKICVGFNPFCIDRKANRWHKPYLARSIKNIEFVGIKPTQCIKTSSKSQCYITDGHIVTHNTCDVIAAVCWLRDRVPDVKTLVVTTRSTTWQWYDEIRRFSQLRPFVMVDNYRGLKSYPARHQQLRDFLSGTKKDILIGKYSSMIGARKRVAGQFDDYGNPAPDKVERVSGEIREFASILKGHGHRVALVFDEAHRFKTPGSQTRALVMNLARQCQWAWGLTGTAMKNDMTEFYAALSALGIRPHGNMWDFGKKFCIFHKQYVGRGIHKQVLDGYKDVPDFKRGVRPFYLGRSQAQVKEPLPKLQTIYHPVDLDARQTKLLLDEIPNGTFILPPTLVRIAGEIYEKERDPSNAMTMLSVQQLVANHWGLIDRTDTKSFYSPTLSPKEEALLDLLDGDLKGEKVIVFSKFLRHIDRLEKLTELGKFTSRRFLRITGNENEKERNANKRLFQESPDHDVIFINAAGIEGLNLQQAAHMVCLDLPWSWGDLIQLVGRMVRSVSPHSLCTLHIIVAKGTVDEYTIDILLGKKGVFEAILGEGHSAGLLGGSTEMDLESGMEAAGTEEEFKLEMLRHAHRRNASMKEFLLGERIQAAQGDDEYLMIFEKKPGNLGNKKRNPALEEEPLEEAPLCP